MLAKRQSNALLPFETILQGADPELRKDIIARIKKRIGDDPRFRGTWEEILQLGDLEMLDTAVLAIYSQLISCGADVDPKVLNSLERIVRVRSDVIKSLLPKVEKRVHFHLGEDALTSMVVGSEEVIDIEVKE